jgi:hypothetical protein
MGLRGYLNAAVMLGVFAGAATASAQYEGSVSSYSGDSSESSESSDSSQATDSSGSEADDGPERYWAFRIGGDLGFAAIENANYWNVNLVGLLRAGPVRADVWAPLLFSVDDYRFREESWDDARDFGRIARCVRVDLGDYDTPEDVPDTAATCEPRPWAGHGIHDRVYFTARLSPITSETLGHGTLVSEFRNSTDLDRPQLGIRSETTILDWGYTQFLLDDVTAPHVIGGRLAMRPPQLFLGDNWDETADDFEVGFSAVSDLRAPLHLQTAFGRPLQEADGDLRYTTQAMTAVGVDVHYTYYWGLFVAEDPLSGLDFFVDYNRFLDVDDADGLHAGVRFVYKDVYSEEASQFQFRGGAEFRYLGNRYVPTYFDTDYVVRSQRFGLTDQALAAVDGDPHRTLLEYVLARPDGYTYGFQGYLEFLVPIPTGRGLRPTILPISMYVEGSEQPASWSASATVGPFQMDQLIVMAQYLRRNFSGPEGIVDPNGALFEVLGRFYLANPNDDSEGATWLNKVYVDMRFDHRFFLDPQGDFRGTNDFVLTVGFTAGTD